MLSVWCARGPRREGGAAGRPARRTLCCLRSWNVVTVTASTACRMDSMSSAAALVLSSSGVVVHLATQKQNS